MNYIKSIFQAAIFAGGLALGSAASQAMPLAQSPGPVQMDAAKAANGIVDVGRYSRSRWCYRHPRACNRRDYRRYRYRHRYYNPNYYGYYRPYYRPRYYDYGYPYYGYGYYGRPRVGLWWSF